MKKIVSTSLWGDDPKYCVGAIKNASILSSYYPDWILNIYAHKNVDKDILKKAALFKNVNIIEIDLPADWTAMFWRFYPVFDDSVECFICRDLDSRFNARESEATKQWLLSDKNVHIMRDHPYHGFLMLGGMIGFKKPVFPKLITSLNSCQPSDRYGTDYEFFHDKLYPLILGDALVHDEFFEKKPFPTKRVDREFVGEVFNEFDEPVEEHRAALAARL